MPFSGRWFYGDTLFIADPWMWLALAVGIVWARVRENGGPEDRRTGDRRTDGPTDDGPVTRGRGDRATWPARIAIALVLLYIGAMAASAARMRGRVMAAMGAHAPPPLRVMVAPLPVTALTRQVVVEFPDMYALGAVRVPSGRFAGEWVRIPKHDALPAAHAAAATPTGRTYLRWARFPFFAVGEDCRADHVCIRDARYFPMDWAEVAVPVGGTVTLGPALPPGTTP